MPVASNPDLDLDLVLVRDVDVSPAFVWAAWTQPDLLKRWFCPKPWQTVDAEIDLVPGGTFRTVMRGPDGTEFANAGCYLEIVPGRRLVWSSALGPGYRPQVAGPAIPFTITAVIDVDATSSGGTRYVATVLHADVASRQQHEAMGFHAGWGAAFDQLVAMAPPR